MYVLFLSKWQLSNSFKAQLPSSQKLKPKMYLLLAYLILFVAFLLFIRTLYILFVIRHDRRPLDEISNYKSTMKTLIILGSGGHSTEMLRLVESLNQKIFKPKIYVIASSDNKSKEKLLDLEKYLGKQTQYQICEIPRSRKVHQSYISSIFTTLYSILYCFPLVINIRPDLILCNGPGTCIPICFIAFLMRVLNISNNVIVFVESICRVQSLSLSGIILYYFADIFLVQWVELTKKYKRARYIGRLWFYL